MAKTKVDTRIKRNASMFMFKTLLLPSQLRRNDDFQQKQTIKPLKYVDNTEGSSIFIRRA
ncbi:hypothetical protein [Yersinia ruckeri]|uniref:hypothetical protein n=1 Tax=Yersinia ruckeri TaxID=29486 RepID=UPI00139222D0|nr:hypothetical protein [Yersinia ruckeri]MCW6568601.1 hypothetical protein [Yersinia ruckeri]